MLKSYFAPSEARGFQTRVCRKSVFVRRPSSGVAPKTSVVLTTFAQKAVSKIGHLKLRIVDFNIQKDAIGLVYALDLTFTQNGDDLQISGNDGVNTLLRNVDKDDFLANFPDNLFDAAAVEVTLI